MTDTILLGALDLLRTHGPNDAENLLYSRWFHEEVAQERDYPRPEAYRAATLDSERFEPGWRVIAATAGAAGAVIAEKNGEQRFLAPPECAPERPGCLRFTPGELLLADPLAGTPHNGFWHLSPSAWRRGPPARRQRLYFGVAPGDEVTFARLFAGRAPIERNWTFKILCGRHSAGRQDAAVLYLDENEAIEDGWVADLIAGAGPLLTGTVPKLTRPLAAGVGWARDPGDNLSYGQLLCKTLGEIAAREGMLADEAAWLDAARRKLAGIVPTGVIHD